MGTLGRKKNMAVVEIPLLLSFLCLLSPFVLGSENRTFRAAVYEHAVYVPPERLLPVTRETALQNLKPNMDKYQEIAALASQKNADILVFPEDGLCGLSFSRVSLAAYSETIPDPRSRSWNPCLEEEQLVNVEVQIFLSCLAKNTSLYIVANFPDKQPCSLATDPRCPPDGWYQYNTNVVYSPNGTLLAKYHKVNLFFVEMGEYDVPAEVDYATFETPFGKFGVFTCFDVLFHEPAITLIEKHGVRNIVFPTAWMDALPLLAAVQFHSAFAMGASVNFLAANLHLPEGRFHGSGIFTPVGPSAYYYNATTGSPGQLVVQEIDVNSGALTPHSLTASDIRQMYNELLPFSFVEFVSEVFNDLYNFVSLSNPEGKLTVCHNKLCCQLEYSAALSESELYAFGAFDGLHTYEGTYYLQVCTLLRCATQDRKTCGATTQEAEAVFSRLYMRSTILAKYIFPAVTLSDRSFLSLAPGEYEYQNRTLLSTNGFSKPLLSASLIGRVYEWDDRTVQSCGHLQCGSITLGAVIVVICCIQHFPTVI